MKLFTRCLFYFFATGVCAVWLGTISQPSMGQKTKAGDSPNSDDPRQTYTLADEKRSRTPAQRKIDSQLLYALRQKRGETRGVPARRIELKLDDRGRTVVDITSADPSQLVSTIEGLDGVVISLSPKYHTIRALLALEKLEGLAGSKEVKFISLPARAMTRGTKVTN
jgi:hypothetical protein